jgi:hypothetical protein
MSDYTTKNDYNNFLYAYEASWDRDPRLLLATSKAPLLAINTTDEQVNLPELGECSGRWSQYTRGRAMSLFENQNCCKTKVA